MDLRRQEPCAPRLGRVMPNSATSPPFARVAFEGVAAPREGAAMKDQEVRRVRKGVPDVGEQPDRNTDQGGNVRSLKLMIAAFCAVLASAGAAAFAQSVWPTKPITMIVPYL